MKEILILDPAVAAGHRYHVSGTLAEWQQNVSLICEDNSRLTLGVSAALAAPLLYMIKAPNIGIHLRGISSIGKTTALYAAGSVWGGGGEDNNLGFVQSWRTTSNGLELQCALHNDAILCLDEISLVSEKEIGDIVYCLGNGVGKRRATRDIKSRPVVQFRLVFLSCGERSLHEMMAGAGKRTKGGQESRLIDIPADPGYGLGVFENLHGYKDGATLSHRLTENSKTFYGIASRTLTRYLMDHFDETIPLIKKYRADFVEDLSLKENFAAGEVYRVAEALGLIAAGGELGTKIGITGWHAHAATIAARRAFDAWRHERGDSYAAYDVRAGVQAVSAFLFRFRSRFQPLDADEDAPRYPIHDQAGFVEDDNQNDCRRFYINRQIFQDEICRGYDHQMVLHELQKHGHLVADSDGKHLSVKKYIKGEGVDRFYAVLSTVCDK